MFSDTYVCNLIIRIIPTILCIWIIDWTLFMSQTPAYIFEKSFIFSRIYSFNVFTQQQHQYIIIIIIFAPFEGHTEFRQTDCNILLYTRYFFLNIHI